MEGLVLWGQPHFLLSEVQEAIWISKYFMCEEEFWFTLVANPLAGSRPKDDRMPYKLLKEHGILIEPAKHIHENGQLLGFQRAILLVDWPNSDPHPIGEPFIAMSAPSPPDAPPADNNRLYGFIVRPMILLQVSPI